MNKPTLVTPAFVLPDLVEIQRESFRWFLEEGLIEELESFSPITDYTGKMELHFIAKDYKLKRPKYSVDESKRRDATYAVQMYVPTRLINKETGEIKDIPALYFNKPTNHFTLKNIDKRVSTLRGLAPKKKQGTAKNIKVNDSDSEKDD